MYLKVKLPREYIKLSPLSSAIIPHRLPDGQLTKTGYVKLSAFFQVSKQINYKKIKMVFVHTHLGCPSTLQGRM